MIVIKNKVKGVVQDRDVDLYIGPGLRKIANDAVVVSAGWPKNFSALQRLKSLRYSAIPGPNSSVLDNGSSVCRDFHHQHMMMFEIRTSAGYRRFGDRGLLSVKCFGQSSSQREDIHQKCLSRYDQSSTRALRT